MKREDALKQIEVALAELHQALGEGKSEQLKQYLAVMAKFHRYSFGNILMILGQRPEATNVAGFRKWKELGRYVRKGEKGIAILAPCKGKRRIENDDGDLAELHVIRGFKIVHVFDQSQTDGQELPEFTTVTGEPGEYLACIEQVIRREGIELAYAPLPPHTLGMSHGGRITIHPELSPAEKFSVAVHELAHERLHQNHRKHDTSKTVLETEAEATAFVVCQAFGLDSARKSSDYIQLYRGKPETLADSLDRIQKTASWTIDAVTAAATHIAAAAMQAAAVEKHRAVTN